MRNTILLEKGWTFYKNPQSETGEAVTLPHTWNAVDGQDGGNDYYRGTCKYVRIFIICASFRKTGTGKGRKSVSGI